MYHRPCYGNIIDAIPLLTGNAGTGDDETFENDAQHFFLQVITNGRFLTEDTDNIIQIAEIATTICQSGILKDAYREAAVQHGALFTFPSKKTRIDFIFVKHATVLSTRTIVRSLSDHYPMVIVVEI